jgi:Ca2+/Na+ antiporter
MSLGCSWTTTARLVLVCVSGVFITKGDVGVGTIVGSAVFNILCIIGVCGLFAGQVGLATPLRWFYLISRRWKYGAEAGTIMLEFTHTGALGSVIGGLHPEATVTWFPG